MYAQHNEPSQEFTMEMGGVETQNPTTTKQEIPNHEEILPGFRISRRPDGKKSQPKNPGLGKDLRDRTKGF